MRRRRPSRRDARVLRHGTARPEPLARPCPRGCPCWSPWSSSQPPSSTSSSPSSAPGTPRSLARPLVRPGQGQAHGERLARGCAALSGPHPFGVRTRKRASHALARVRVLPPSPCGDRGRHGRVWPRWRRHDRRALAHDCGGGLADRAAPLLPGAGGASCRVPAPLPAPRDAGPRLAGRGRPVPRAPGLRLLPPVLAGAAAVPDLVAGRASGAGLAGDGHATDRAANQAGSPLRDGRPAPATALVLALAAGHRKRPSRGSGASGLASLGG